MKNISKPKPEALVQLSVGKPRFKGGWWDNLALGAGGVVAKSGGVWWRRGEGVVGAWCWEGDDKIWD